jgi:hypothetical protein
MVLYVWKEELVLDRNLTATENAQVPWDSFITRLHWPFLWFTLYFRGNSRKWGRGENMLWYK